MRRVLLASVLAFAGCASQQLASVPPAGVDLSGHWTLNVADSDDAQRLMQSQIAAETAGVGAGGSTSPAGGRGRRGGAGPGAVGPAGPMMPSVTTLDESLRWPGRDLSIKQTGDTVTFVSDGTTRSCHPSALKGGKPHHRSGGDEGGAHSRNYPTRGRGDAPPPRCGWDTHSLVVQSGEPEEDRPPYEQRFSVSDDGQRLEEVVVFKGGRSSGFVASREWDRDGSATSGAGGSGVAGGAASGTSGATKPQ